MGLRDALFGRTKQVAPNLDNLFALPTAALTLESELDLVSSGQAGLCFKGGSGESTITTDDDIKQLLDFDETTNKVTLTKDDLGFEWLVVTDPDFEALVTRLRMRPSFTRWKKLIGMRCIRSKISWRRPLTTVSPISRA